MGLIGRIAGLLAIALSLAAAAHFYEDVTAYRARKAELHDEALRLATLAAANFDRVTESARQVLVGLAEFPALKRRDSAACDEFVRTLKQRYHSYEYFGVFEPDGTAFCNSNTDSGRVAMPQALLFEADSPNDFIVGRYRRALSTGIEVLPFAYRARNARGELTTVLHVGINLAWLNREVAEWHLPPDTVLELADRNGTLIARYPDPERVGGKLPEGLMAVVDGPGRATLETSDLDGVDRIYGYIAPGQPLGSSLFVSIGLDKAKALASIRRPLWNSVAIFIVSLLVAAAVSWIYLDRLIRGPFDRLLQAAAEWRRGDWSARVGLTEEASEIGRLGAAFDAMADAVGQRETALRRGREHLDQAQRVAHTGSWQFDLQSRRIEWSEETYRIMGLARDGFDPTPAAVRSLVLDDDLPTFDRMAQQVLAGEVPPPIEYRVRRSDGAVCILYQEAEGIHDEADKLAALVGVVRDVTQLRAAERKHEELEAQLFHSQKLEALGTLAGGIAHDLNNALMPVIGLTELVMRRLPTDSSERKHLEHVCEAGRQARKLVQQVLAFSRKTVATKEPVRLDALVGEALGMVRASLPTTLQLRHRLEPVPAVLGDRGQLYQVLLNLVTNAAHAIGGRQGTVAIDVAAEGPFVRLSVEDDGCGMDEATRLRIFEPFFTTKAVNEGTGLGLSVVHGIVTSHGGRIDVASRPGVGTRFDVWLPVHETPATPELDSGEAAR